MDIKHPEPLIVEVETKDGASVNVLLTKSKETSHFFELNDGISYYFDIEEATEPQDLIGMKLFGENINFKCRGVSVSSNDHTIVKIKKVINFYTKEEILYSKNYLTI